MANLGSCQQQFECGAFLLLYIATGLRFMFMILSTHRHKKGMRKPTYLRKVVERTGIPFLLLYGVTRSLRKQTGNLRQHASLETTLVLSTYTEIMPSRVKPKPWWSSGESCKATKKLTSQTCEKLQALARFWATTNKINPAHLCVSVRAASHIKHNIAYIDS